MGIGHHYEWCESRRYHSGRHYPDGDQRDGAHQASEASHWSGDSALASDWLMVTSVSGCQSSISAMAGITPELIDGAVWIFRQVFALSVASLHFIGVASKVEENVAAANIIQSCVLRSQDWKLISLSLNIPPLPPVNTPPGSTWLFSNEKNDFQILFKFATWPAPSSPPSPTLIPFPVSVCSFTAGADQVINEDIDGGSDVTTQFSGKWWWFALRRSEKSSFSRFCKTSWTDQTLLGEMNQITTAASGFR